MSVICTSYLLIKWFRSTLLGLKQRQETSRKIGALDALGKKEHLTIFYLSTFVLNRATASVEKEGLLVV